MEGSRLLFASDDAVLVRFEEKIDPGIAARVRQADLSVRKAAFSWVSDIIPSYNELLVCYDLSLVSPDTAMMQITEALEAGPGEEAQKARLVRIPVCYGGKHGPDMCNVCAHTKLSEDEVIKLHSRPDYFIYMIGFTIGFPYLGGMDERLETPRLAVPRTLVQRGSVGIGGKQTGVYTLDSPGGWQLIGKSPVKFADVGKSPPSVLAAGDYLRFVPIDEAEFSRIRSEVEEGSYELDISEVG